MYIPLHTHDKNGSVGDALLDLEDYVERAETLKLPALGISNHGSMSTIYKFNALCHKKNIKPLFGVEIYLSLDKEEDLIRYLQLDKKEREASSFKPGRYYHLVVYAMDSIGLKNTLHITTHGATETFYKKPLVTEDYLFQHTEGVIALSACIGGLIPQMILSNEDNTLIEKTIKRYQKAFNGLFYLELQPSNRKEQIEVNALLEYFSEKLDVPVIATNDIHYLNKEDAIIHNIHVADHRGKSISVKDPLLYGDDCYYFMTEEEMSLPGVDLETQKKAIANTKRIADMCNVELPHQVQMPIFDATIDCEAKIKEIAYRKLRRIIGTVKNPYLYTERLQYELNVIKKLGFIDYFLIIWDVLRYAREVGISVGPGRGSVSNSLLAYMLDITKVDSIKHNLIFERFLSEYRTSLPDIDLDICSERREELINYVQNKYGYEHCAQVSTEIVRKAKMAIKDAGRALGLDSGYIQAIADLIPTTHYNEDGEKEDDLSIENSLYIVPELKVYQQKEPELFRYAIGLQDIPKSKSIHAAGILIFPYDLKDYLPLVRSKNENRLATSLTLHDAENVAIKFDFLGLRTLDFIDQLEKATGFRFDYENESLLKDKHVWHNIGTTLNSGLFQVSSYTYRKRMYRIKPKTIDELAACLALIRGPCISSKLDESYMAICEGKKKIELIHPIYDKATATTHNIMIYQEQNMALFENAGLSREDSFKLMKLLAKKKADEAIHFKKEFFACCSKHNMGEQLINYIWGLVENSAKYSFNAGHGTAYALLTYVTAYYKTYYPKVFFATLLTHEYRSKKKPASKKIVLETIVSELKKYNYRVLLPDINQCEEHFICLENSPYIMTGTCAIKTFGSSFNQFNRPFTRIEDFFNGRHHVNTYKNKTQAAKDWRDYPIPRQTSVIAGIFAGLFDEALKMPRQAIYKAYVEKSRFYVDGGYELKSVISFNQKNKEGIQKTIPITASNDTFEKTYYDVKF